MIIFRILLYLGSFLIIWFSAGVIIKSIENLAHRFKISPFTMSFFVLGILTSIPEFSVGINSIINKTPDIFIGNLLGASLIIFIFIIPLLAVFGGGVKLTHQLSENNLIFSLLVVAAPVFLIADNVITRTEGVFLILIYIILFYFIEKKHGLMGIIIAKKDLFKKNFVVDAVELLFASLVIFLVSRYIVTETVYFSSVLKVSQFIISLIVLSIGTNLPEISLAVKAIINGKNEVALGDYIGSAAANSLFFGIFTLFNGGRVYLSVYSFRIMFLTLLGLGVFFIFSRSKKDISKKEGLILLSIYLLFIVVEVVLP
jgi:cation:H+ antiporter